MSFNEISVDVGLLALSTVQSFVVEISHPKFQYEDDNSVFYEAVAENME